MRSNLPVQRLRAALASGVEVTMESEVKLICSAPFSPLAYEIRGPPTKETRTDSKHITNGKIIVNEARMNVHMTKRLDCLIDKNQQ